MSRFCQSLSQAEVRVSTSFEISRAFVQQNARVIMVNREEEQGKAAISRIKQDVGEHAQIDWLHCDLGSLKNVRAVFTDLAKKEERLDLVSMPVQLNK